MLLAALFWVALWHFLSIIVDSDLLVPSPYKTIITLIAMVRKKVFWQSIASSIVRITGGYIVAMLAGCTLGILSGRIRMIKTLFDPFIRIVRAAPVASFIVLALVWIKTNILPAFISSLIVIPLFYSNMQDACFRIDKKMTELCDVMNVSFKDRYSACIQPAFLPAFKNASVNAIGLAWKSGIAAEIICRPHLALGTILGNGKNTLETSEVFAVTLVIILLSMVFDTVMRTVWGNKNDPNK